MSKEVADRFAEALRKLEEGRDVEALVEIHAEDCDVGNVAVPRTFSGHEGLREFWTGYREAFGEIHSEFRNVVSDDGAALLEWQSKGTVANGDDIVYEGVTVLEVRGDRITRSTAYFDPRAIVEHLSGVSA